jgi:hypothetical protein
VVILREPRPWVFAVASKHLCDRAYAIDVWNDISLGDKRSIVTIEVKAIGKNPATQKMGSRTHGAAASVLPRGKLRESATHQ